MYYSLLTGRKSPKWVILSAAYSISLLSKHNLFAPQSNCEEHSTSSLARAQCGKLRISRLCIEKSAAGWFVTHECATLYGRGRRRNFPLASCVLLVQRIGSAFTIVLAVPDTSHENIHRRASSATVTTLNAHFQAAHLSGVNRSSTNGQPSIRDCDCAERLICTNTVSSVGKVLSPYKESFG